MLDLLPSPTLPRFAFGEYDEVIMDGISYRAIDCTGDGYVFARTDGTGVAESFSHAVLSQRVTLGGLQHRRDAFLPESAKRRLRAPAQELSPLPLKQQKKAKYHESLVRAFLEMEAEGKVKRTEKSAKAALPEIKFRAGPSATGTCSTGSMTRRLAQSAGSDRCRSCRKKAPTSTLTWRNSGWFWPCGTFSPPVSMPSFRSPT